MTDPRVSAFPTSTDANGPFGGLSRRQYFAARAPHEIPEWFEPDCPAKPETPAHYLDEDTERRAVNFALSKTDSMTAKGAMLEIRVYRIPPETVKPYLAAFPEIRGWYGQWQEYLEASEEWERRYILARAGQWPWYWADLVLSAEDAP